MKTVGYDFIPQANPGASYLACKDEIDKAYKRCCKPAGIFLGKRCGNLNASLPRISA